MDADRLEIELDATRWEQWVGASLRAARLRELVAARPRQRQRPAGHRPPRTRASLVWMFAVTAAGYLLLA